MSRRKGTTKAELARKLKQMTDIANTSTSKFVKESETHRSTRGKLSKAQSEVDKSKALVEELRESKRMLLGKIEGLKLALEILTHNRRW